MLASEIRTELVQEHKRLREMIESARGIARRGCAGEPVLDELRSTLIRLSNALRMHNLREEDLLRGVLVTVDAWGQAREEIMTEEHAQEHEEFFAALVGVRTTPIEFAGAGVALLLDRILEHMAREETAFLGADVLRDDVVSTDSSGG